MIKEGLEKAKQKRLGKASVEIIDLPEDVENEDVEAVSTEEEEKTPVKVPSWTLSKEEKAAAVKGAEQHAQEAQVAASTAKDEQEFEGFGKIHFSDEKDEIE